MHGVNWWVPVCNCMLYYCAGVKEEGEKEKRPVNNLLFVCAIIKACIVFKRAHYKGHDK